MNKIYQEERKHCVYIVALVSYTILSFLSIYPYLIKEGTLGFRHDWRMPLFFDQFHFRIEESIYLWNGIEGFGGFPSTTLYERIFEFLVMLLTGFNAELFSKIIVCSFMVISALTMFFLGMTLKFLDKTSFFMGLFYMLTPVLYNKVVAGHHLYTFAYALSPLFFAFLHKYLNEQKISHLIASSLVFGTSAVQVQFPLMLSFMAVLYLMVFVASKRNVSAIILSFKTLMVLLTIFALLNSFWIPYVFWKETSTISGIAPLDYHEIINAPKPFPAFLMTGYDHVYDIFYLYTHDELPFFVIFSLLLVVIFSITGAIIASNHRKNREIVLYSLLLLTSGLFFVTAVNGPFPEVWKFLYINFPLIRAFREVYHSMFLVSFAYILLFGLFVEETQTKLKHLKKYVFSGLLLILIIAAGFPILNSYMNQLQVLKCKEDCVSVYDFLKGDEELYRVMFIPSLSPIQHPNIDRPSLDLMIKYSPKPTFSQQILRQSPLNDLVLYYTMTAINNPDKLRYLNELLSKLGVKYIICRSDYTSYYPYYVPMRRYLIEVHGNASLYNNWFNTSVICSNVRNSSEDLILIYNNTHIVHIDGRPFFYPTSYLTMTFSFEKMLSAMPYLNNNTAVAIINPALKNSVTINNSEAIICNENNVADLQLIVCNNSVLVVPTTLYIRPDENWATDPISWYIHPSIAIAPINGGNSVLTWASSKLKENPMLNNNDIITQWVFDSLDELNLWKNYTCENRFGSLYALMLDNGALKAELYNSTWGWKTINSPLIPAEHYNWYRWQLQIKAENAHSTHIKILEYNQDKKLINAKQVKNVGSGSFDWQTITIDYTPENPETKYIQLQIWHGHETTQPLPNTIWIDNVKIYNLKRFTEPVTLEIPFTLQETNQYIFLTRLFQNQKGGKIQIQLDNKN